MFNKILVALDHSTTSQQVLAHAVTLAQKTGATLLLLHVLSPFDENYPDLPLTPGVDSYYPVLRDQALKTYNDQWETFARHGLELLQTETNHLTALGIPTEFSQNMGDPGRAICAVARNWQADLIIMGRRGRSGLSEFFLGSVSNYVTHHASCSVLTVQGAAPPSEPPLSSSQEASHVP